MKKRKTQAPPKKTAPTQPTPEPEKIPYSAAMRERRVGAPTKYNPDFHPASYIELSATGKTKAQIAAAWGIDRDTLLEWSKDRVGKPELSGAIKKGDVLRTSWWTNHAISIATGGNTKGDTGMTIFLMKNICSADFRDKPEHHDGLDVEDIEW